MLLRTFPRLLYTNVFFYATKTKSTIPAGYLLRAKEEDRLFFFLSRGYPIKKGKTTEALKIVLSQYEKDFQIAHDYAPYLSTIPADYIENTNRDFFQTIFYRKNILKTIVDFDYNLILEVKKIIEEDPVLSSTKIILTKDDLKSAEAAMLLTWISNKALSTI